VVGVDWEGLPVPHLGRRAPDRLGRARTHGGASQLSCCDAWIWDSGVGVSFDPAALNCRGAPGVENSGQGLMRRYTHCVYTVLVVRDDENYLGALTTCIVGYVSSLQGALKYGLAGGWREKLKLRRRPNPRFSRLTYLVVGLILFCWAPLCI
jgi:hypothetical protein